MTNEIRFPLERRMQQIADDAVGRGAAPNAAVLIAPWDGPNGEIVLIARDSNRRLLGEPLLIPGGADHAARQAAVDGMWARVGVAIELAAGVRAGDISPRVPARRRSDNPKPA